MKLSLIDFGTNADLPQKVRESLPDDATATLFRTHLNSHLRDGRTEMHAYIKAYRALADMGLEEREGKWLAKSIPAVGDVHVDTPLGSRKPKHKDDPGSEEPDVAEFEEEATTLKLYVPPAEVQAAAKAAVAGGTEFEWITVPLSKGEGVTLGIIQEIGDSLKEGHGFNGLMLEALGGTHGAKWANRILRKARKPVEVDYDTENVKRSVADPTCCDICEESAEQGWIPDDDVFESGEDTPPHHPNCGCTVEYKTRRVKKSADVEIAGTVAKVDQAQHIVFGWFSVISVGGKPVVDTQDDIISAETLESAAYSFVLDSRVAGEMHQDGKDGEIRGVGRLVESVVFTSEKVGAMVQSLKDQGIAATIDLGCVAWWGGMKIDDPKVWEAVTAGNLKAWSIGGKAKRDKCA